MFEIPAKSVSKSGSPVPISQEILRMTFADYFKAHCEAEIAKMEEVTQAHIQKLNDEVEKMDSQICTVADASIQRLKRELQENERS